MPVTITNILGTDAPASSRAVLNANFAALKAAVDPLMLAPPAHGHVWGEVSGKPTTLAGYGIVDAAPLGHNHDAAYKAIGWVPSWAEVTGKPATFPPDAHNHDSLYRPIGWVPGWTDVTGKPSTFPPDVHSHTFASLTSKPTTLTGYGITDAALATHNHDAAYRPIGWVPGWADVTGKPATFPPEAHNHDSVYQALLVSGTNIKTINGSSILGSGNLAVSGGGGGGETFDASFDGQGNVVSDGVDVWRPVAVGGTITKAALVADVTGSVTVTVRKYTPSGGALGTATLLGTIVLSGARHATSTPSWAVAAGDVLEVEISGAAAITKLFARFST